MQKIEDYGLVGDCRTAALVSRFGSIDWLCLPYFDSPACFASLLGTKDNGFWSLHPEGDFKSHQVYRDSSMVLETFFENNSSKVLLTDFMGMAESGSDLFRIVTVLEGEAHLSMKLSPRFEYGNRIPMFLARDNYHLVTKGPHQIVLRSENAEVYREADTLCSRFRLQKGQSASFQLSWCSSFEHVPQELDCRKALKETDRYWKEWLESCHLDDRSEHPEIIRRAVLILKAMTCRDFGSIVAAVTTSLPAQPGGTRNWDYRYCWPRDAALAMRAVLNSTGQQNEIKAWRHWIMRATAGLPEQMEVLYCLDGTGALYEVELEWLAGHNGSRPVRIGNLAREQVQLDIYASTIEVFYLAEKMGFPPFPECWKLAHEILRYLGEIWERPDSSIWEVRGSPRQFVHSKVMVWSAFDLCIRAHDELGIEGPVEEWKKSRDNIHRDICEKGYNKKLGSFTQYYGSDKVDASLLRLPILGFLPVDDERISGTIQRIENELLLEEGLVMRYRPDPGVEGLPETGKRAFILCSAWLGEVYALQGRIRDAEKVFEKIISLTNPLGLLSEQYDPQTKSQCGNFPQAFSHIALINLEIALAQARKS